MEAQLTEQELETIARRAREQAETVGGKRAGRLLALATAAEMAADAFRAALVGR